MAKKGQPLSAETKRKIGEAAIQRFKEREPLRVLEEKPCSKCRKVKPLSEFGLKKYTHKSVVTVSPDSWCKQCHRDRSKARAKKLKEEGRTEEVREQQRQWRERNRERYLEQKRENEAARRRKQGGQPRNFAKGRKGPSHWNEGLPVTPIREFLEHEISNGRGVNTIEAATGVDHRRIGGILKEEYPHVTLDVVDRLLVGLGCPEELHFLYPAEEEELIVGYSYLEAAA